VALEQAGIVQKFEFERGAIGQSEPIAFALAAGRSEKFSGVL
jgi:hypothetical protein